MEELSGSRSGAVPCVTTLTANPRTPYLLWISAAGRVSTTLQREGESSTLSKKLVWNCIATLVRAGFTAQVAIDRIYQVYGERYRQ
jgi:hypothetical protein